jgi:hypothetical protein
MLMIKALVGDADGYLINFPRLKTVPAQLQQHAGGWEGRRECGCYVW